MFRVLRESIAAKVTLLIIILVMFSASLVGMIFYFRGVSYFTEVEINKIDTQSQSMEDKIQQYYSTIEQQSHAAYHVLGNLISNTKKKDEKLFSFLKPFSSFSHGIIVYENGSSVYFDKQGIKEGAQYTIPYKQYGLSLNTLPNGNFISQIHLERKGGHVVEPLRSLVSVYIKTSERDYGIFFNFEAKFLFKFLSDIATAKDFELIIFDRYGKILLHPNSVKNFSSELSLPYNISNEFSDVIISHGGSDFSNNFKGIAHYKGDEKVLIAKLVSPGAHPNVKIGFALFSSYNRILSGLQFIRSQSIAISFLLILLTAFIGWYVVKYLLKNLNDITDVAKRYTQGESDLNVSVNSSDEIGILALTFQGMIRQVNERTRVLRKSERTIREARDQAEKALSAKSQLLDDIRRQNEEIELMAKDKDDLLAIVSHDLKNPLAIVETSMDILLVEDDVRNNKNIKDLVRRSKSNAQYALNLITDLLDLARMEGGIKLDFDVFNVNEMIEVILDSLDIKAKEKKISLTTQYSGIFEIKADYGRLVQVINNVVGNALKFVPESGNINIILESFESNRKVDGNSNFLRIKIKDNGPGIPASKLDSIFDKFSQARESDRKIGTGLGLAICQNIVEMHTGDIRVESVEGEGATFIIELPRVNEVVMDIATSQKIEIEDLGKAELPLVYLYETNNEFRESLTQFITQNDYRVISFGSFKNLCDRVSAQVPDIIIFDIDKDEVEGMSKLKSFMLDSNRASIPIICSTEFLSQNDHYRRIKSVQEILPKDNNFEAYIEKVHQVLFPAMGVASERSVDELKKTVLVVDDEEIIRELIIEKLENHGFNALSAKGGTEAIFLFKKYDVDLIISDLRMQEMDGMALTRLIREEDTEVPIILMSANIVSLPHDLIESLKVSKLMSKPFDLDELAESVSFLVGVDLSKANVEAKVKEDKKEVEVKSLKPRLLLVDDSEDMNLLFTVMLKGIDVELDYASGGEDALKLFKEFHYDYVFLDMKMPGMGGDEVLIEMKKIDKGNGTQYFVISANDSPKDLELYEELGFDKALNKPINKNKILDAINFTGKEKS